VPLPLAEATHPVCPLPTNVTCKQRAEPVPSEPHRLVANVDAALVEQILDVAQGQRVFHVRQHCQANDLW
jgi:hypothetical protein